MCLTMKKQVGMQVSWVVAIILGDGFFLGTDTELITEFL